MRVLALPQVYVEDGDEYSCALRYFWGTWLMSWLVSYASKHCRYYCFVAIASYPNKTSFQFVWSVDYFQKDAGFGRISTREIIVLSGTLSLTLVCEQVVVSQDV